MVPHTITYRCLATSYYILFLRKHTVPKVQFLKYFCTLYSRILTNKDFVHS